MVAAQIPARLVCIITKERSPFYLRSAFPGASVSHEIAEAMLKAETTPSSHLLPLAGGDVGTSVNAVGGSVRVLWFCSVCIVRHGNPRGASMILIPERLGPRSGSATVPSGL